MEWLADPQSWIGLLTLTVLEVVLGIDNIIFISILVSRLPKDRQDTARITGLALAMLTRVALLQQSTRPTQWAEWFELAGAPTALALRGPQSEHFAMIAQAAVSHLGAALLPCVREASRHALHHGGR